MLRNTLIYIIVFICGWALMAVEILGGRMLAPVFGSGIEVWGSIIGVFLLSLSLGYFLGGFLSQKAASIYVLIKIVASAGILIAILPLYYDKLTITLWDFGPRFGPLASSVLLYLPPSVLLGMVSPYSIHLSTSSIASVGVNSGLLYATSTIGSFLGCIITAFYLITMVGIKNILFAAGLLLITVAIVGYFTSKNNSPN